MFGMNDNGNQQGGSPPVTEPSVVPAPDSNPIADSPSPVMPGPPSDSGMPDSGAMPPIVTPSMPSPPDMTTPGPSEPATAPAMPAAEPHPDQEEPAAGGINGVSLESAYAPAEPPQITSNYSKPSPSSASPMPEPGNEELLGIKQQALQSLAPLVDELDQSPDEKFKTTMMLIQASDNADLVKEAFAAANQISDEKTRAQALLDVVNEINYFTQPHTEDAEPEGL